jgi:hypothetical protein
MLNDPVIRFHDSTSEKKKDRVALANEIHAEARSVMSIRLRDAFSDWEEITKNFQGSTCDPNVDANS